LNKLKPFSIVFTSLKLGKHDFEYNIDKSFFDEFDYSPVKLGALKVNLSFNKQETLFVLDFKIKGTVSLTCDRCTDDFDYPMETEERLIFKLGEEEFEQSDEVVVLAIHEHQINVANYIYEFIILSVPFVHIHADLPNGIPGCNKETLAILSKLSVEKSADQPNEAIDPRWEALKKLTGK
jgi:uncharacterized metal-binding protein YceD (DUF177 family)